MTKEETKTQGAKAECIKEIIYCLKKIDSVEFLLSLMLYVKNEISA